MPEIGKFYSRADTCKTPKHTNENRKPPLSSLHIQQIHICIYEAQVPCCIMELSLVVESTIQQPNLWLLYLLYIYVYCIVPIHLYFYPYFALYIAAQHFRVFHEFSVR